MAKLKMTAAAVERLKVPPAGQVDYFDGAYPGLALRVTANGVRSWVYFGRVHGKQKRVTLGRYPGLSLADARKAAGSTADALHSGIDPTAEKRAHRQADRDNFAKIADEWLRRDQATNRSVGEVRRIFARDVLPVFQHRNITDLKRRDIISLVDGIADRGAVTLARRVHAHLHRLFRWSVGRGIIDINPMGDLPKPGTETKRDRVLAEAELAAFWKATERLGHPFQPLFRLLLLTGARRDEIRELGWSEIDGDTIRLKGERTKNGEPHDIPLSPPALELINNLPRIDGSQFVFTTTGKTAVSGFSRAKSLLDAQMAQQSGKDIEPWRLHDLRRTLATGLQRLGIGLQTIEAVLGHISGSRAGIVGVYQRHGFSDEKRVALGKWAEYVISVSEAGR